MATPLLDFWNLKEKPFTLTPDPRYFYLSDTYVETRAKLLYFLKDRSASLFLSGPIGTGKSTLLRLIANEIDADKTVDASYLPAPNLKTSNQLLRRFCNEFDVKTERAYDESLKAFEKFLIKRNKAEVTPLLLLDESQNLNTDELRLIHYLMNFTSATKVLIMFVLVGQPELAEKIGRFASLRSRMISCSISDMTRQDAEKLIKFRWSVAAADENNKIPFTTGALDAIYRQTRGNPRQIVKLCDQALLAAFLKRKKTIEKAVISEAIKDL